MSRQRLRHHGLSFIELLAVTAVLAVVAAVVIPRLTGGSATSKKAACETIQGDIEIQCELWRHNTGAWPTTNLSNISGNISYFPTGVPACPVDGTAYTIDSSGRVAGHNH
jgi:general secretion pathway protein G